MKISEVSESVAPRHSLVKILKRYIQIEEQQRDHYEAADGNHDYDYYEEQNYFNDKTDRLNEKFWNTLSPWTNRMPVKGRQHIYLFTTYEKNPELWVDLWLTPFMPGDEREHGDD